PFPSKRQVPHLPVGFAAPGAGPTSPGGHLQPVGLDPRAAANLRGGVGPRTRVIRRPAFSREAGRAPPRRGDGPLVGAQNPPTPPGALKTGSPNIVRRSPAFMSSVLRPVHPIGSAELLEHVREAYSVGGVELTMDLGGSRNHSLLVTTGSGMLVIRVYRAGIPLDRLAAIQWVRRTLSGRGVPTSVAYRARSGELWSRYEGQIIEVEDYVEHSSQLDTWGRLEVALPILGRVHNILRTLSPSPASKKPVSVNYPTAAEVQEWTPRAMKRIESWPLLPDQIELVRSAEFLSRRL